MKKIYAGKSGDSIRRPNPNWSEVRLTQQWRRVISVFNPGPYPREVQSQALKNNRVLEHRRNLIVSAPTNSGKTLIGWLVLLDAIKRGQRAVMIVPLRAIARERAAEIEGAVTELSKILGRSISIKVSTGDYRIENQEVSAPPSDHGELIIATPERFEAILRNPEYDDWVSTIGAVCVDEAHLIASPRRGPTLEFLITSLICRPIPPRVILLSATIGDTERACEWLAPCDAIIVNERHPALRKEVWELESDEDANEIIINQVKQCLAKPSRQVLIFVYQTRSTEKLANELNARLEEAFGQGFAQAYHSKMTSDQRDRVRSLFNSGKCRCVVATTSLGLGVNMPATHVLIRDCTFAGVGKLGISELLQMMGRAGRGNLSGTAAVIVKNNDGWNAEELASELRLESLPRFISPFEVPQHFPRFSKESDRSESRSIATIIAALLSRQPEQGFSMEELRSFFERSLGGKSIAQNLSPAVSWLMDYSRLLAYRDEHDKIKLTTLGIAATRSVLPLQLAAGFGQLLRDILTIDPRDHFIERWKALDFLIILHLLAENSPSLRPFSGSLVAQVDAWMEKNTAQVPLLFREWIVGQKGSSMAIEVLGSLGVRLDNESGSSEESARRKAYLAVFQSIILFERGRGSSTEEIERKWGVSNFEGIEERWRDDFIWLLSGVTKILDIRSFYYHLREECQVDDERVRRVKHIINNMRGQCFELMESLSHCSPLGPMLLSLKRSIGVSNKSNGLIGIKTIRQLEASGFRTVPDLLQANYEDLIKAGIRRKAARTIVDYGRRRRL